MPENIYVIYYKFIIIVIIGKILRFYISEKRTNKSNLKNDSNIDLRNQMEKSS